MRQIRIAFLGVDDRLLQDGTTIDGDFDGTAVSGNLLDAGSEAHEPNIFFKLSYLFRQ